MSTATPVVRPPSPSQWRQDRERSQTAPVIAVRLPSSPGNADPETLDKPHVFSPSTLSSTEAEKTVQEISVTIQMVRVKEKSYMFYLFA